ncbi:MAG: hypothetical protein AB1422_00245 [bacterium]
MSSAGGADVIGICLGAAVSGVYYGAKGLVFCGCKLYEVVNNTAQEIAQKRREKVKKMLEKEKQRVTKLIKEHQKKAEVIKKERGKDKKLRFQTHKQAIKEQQEIEQRRQKYLQQEKQFREELKFLGQEAEERTAKQIISMNWQEVDFMLEKVQRLPFVEKEAIDRIVNIEQRGKENLERGEFPSSYSLAEEALSVLQETMKKAYVLQEQHYQQTEKIHEMIMKAELDLLETETIAGSFPSNNQQEISRIEDEIRDITTNWKDQNYTIVWQHMEDITKHLSNLSNRLRIEKETWEKRTNQIQIDFDKAVEDAEIIIEMLEKSEEESLQSVREIVRLTLKDNFEEAKQTLAEAQEMFRTGRLDDALSQAKYAQEKFNQIKEKAINTLNQNLQAHISQKIEEVFQIMKYTEIEKSEIKERIYYKAIKGEKIFRVNVSAEGEILYDLDGFKSDEAGQATCLPELQHFFDELKNRGIYLNYKVTGVKEGTGTIPQLIQDERTLQDIVVDRILLSLHQMGYDKIEIETIGKNKVIKTFSIEGKGIVEVDTQGEVCISPHFVELLEETIPTSMVKQISPQEKERS